MGGGTYEWLVRSKGPWPDLGPDDHDDTEATLLRRTVRWQEQRTFVRAQSRSFGRQCWRLWIFQKGPKDPDVARHEVVNKDDDSLPKVLGDDCK